MTFYTNCDKIYNRKPRLQQELPPALKHRCGAVHLPLERGAKNYYSICKEPMLR